MHNWRLKFIPPRTFIILLSLLTGVLCGLAAILLKNTVFYTHEILTKGFKVDEFNLLYIAYPFIRITLTVFYVRFVGELQHHHG
jgi:CIC family chloride channel protein